MPENIEVLKKELDRALLTQDAEKISLALARLAQAFPETPEGGEAQFRLGLDALFRKKDLDKAAEHLRLAAKSKGRYSLSARSSLGLVLLRQGKTQQGVFELRKVANTTPPTLVSVSAFGLLTLALRASNPRESARARTEHIRALAKLTESPSREDAALASYMLGMEHKSDGERAEAKRYLDAAVKSGLLSEDTLRSAQSALEDV